MKKDKKKRLHRLAERREERRHIRRINSENGELCYGVISLNRSGCGFVTPEATADDAEKNVPDIFIPPQFLNGAMDGDTVAVALLAEQRSSSPDENRGPAGRVAEVIKRSREYVVGEVINGRTVRPLSKKISGDIEIAGRLRGAKRGDWVKLKLIHDMADEHLAGTVSQTIGVSGSIKSDLDAICAEYDLQPPYSEAEEDAAAAIVQRPIEREDMSRKFTVTIDPIDAKDFDDALSVTDGKEPGTVEIGVHISDVAAFIAPKSQFDKTAAKRGFTAYLPGRTLPMLPKKLTAQISLHTGEKCPAHSVMFLVDKSSGNIISSRRCHSMINVDHRLDYETVQDFLDKKNVPADWSKPMQNKIRLLGKITTLMRKNRLATEEFIDLAMPEIRIMCDENADKISGLARKIQRESEFIVEEFMLAANSAVGREMGEKSLAGIYRVHPAPEPDKLSEFCENISESFGIACGNLADRGEMRKFIAGLPDDPRKPIVLSLLLRALPRAFYQEKAALHFGLGKLKYAHFTSPIRRYPDLTVHQQLWSLDQKQRTRNSAALSAVAILCSEQEENNDNAYFTASDRLKLRFLQENLDNGRENFYEGIVAKVNANGLLADIPEIGIYGFIPNENLPGHDLRRRRGKLSDARGERKYRPGDYIYLRLSSVDPVRGLAEFKVTSK